MEKLVYLLRIDVDRSGDALRDALMAEFVPRLRDAGGERVVLDVHDGHVAAGRPIWRSEPAFRAMVSFWLETADDRAPAEQALAPHAESLAGYVVSESRPLVHETTPGERTPGMNQVTCIRKLPDLDRAEFFRIWHRDHKQVAIETQSTTGYVRNVVSHTLTPGAPPWDAVVEETFPLEALSDPKVFYAAADDAELARNLERMMTSCRRFLDLAPLECTPMSEYPLG